MTDPIPVPVGPCRCPGSPHGDGDIVYLRPELGLTGGLAVEAAMTSGGPQEAQTIAVSLALIRHNVTGWTFTDADGPVPVNDTTIEAMLPYARGGEAVANRAAGLYLEDAFGPLALRVEAQSPTTQTNGSTRPMLASHNRSRRKASGRSSARGSAGPR